jgi:uracil-DNA glycosylase
MMTMDQNNQSQRWQALNERITACRLCPRLVSWREEVARKKRRAFQDWEYWGKAVPGFGDRQARVLVVGLAPGAHGSNRTGRVFTGDDSGVFLYGALYRAGFANQPTSFHKEDGLELKDIYVSAVCRCVPPDNKPSADELERCQPFLAEEISRLENLQGIVILGKIAMDGVIRLYRQRGYELPTIAFGHGRITTFANGMPWWVTSYHPSRQNTQTGRLTPAMFDSIWETVKTLLEKG